MNNLGFLKIGVFVDAANIYMNGGSKMRYDILRHYAQANGLIQRLNAYMTFDGERARTDREYKDRAVGWQDLVRSFGYHTNIQNVQWMVDAESGRRYGRANADMHLIVDLISQAKNLDHIIVATGDGDFVRPVQYVRSLGCRVEVIAFDNVSNDLRKEADVFTSGYMIPELLPTNQRDMPWGEVGSTVRGICYYHKLDEDYGFMAFLQEISSLAWISDPRHPQSPYKAVFFHDSYLPAGINPRSLPDRWTVFEFEIGENERGLVAEDMRLAVAKREAREQPDNNKPQTGYIPLWERTGGIEP